jgi:hypothetical protein
MAAAAATTLAILLEVCEEVVMAYRSALPAEPHASPGWEFAEGTQGSLRRFCRRS